MRPASSIALFSIALAACDPSTTGPLNGPGEYTATVSGDIVETLTGEATFGRLGDQNFEVRWGVILATGVLGEETSDLIVLTRQGSRRTSPTPGIYTIISGVVSDDSTEFVGTYTHNRPPARSTTFSSVEGTLTIESSSDELVEGTFTLDATISAATGSPLGRQVSIEGDFAAHPSLFVINPFTRRTRGTP